MNLGNVTPPRQYPVAPKLAIPSLSRGRVWTCRKPSAHTMESGHWREIDRISGLGILVRQIPVISTILAEQHLF